MKKTVKKVISPAKEKSEGVEGKELPNIPRSIPEKTVSSWLSLASLRSHGEVVIVSFLCGVLLMGIGVVSIELYTNVQELKKREAMHQVLASQKEYWKEIVLKYPDYKDALLQLAVVSYQLGERDEALRAIGKVLEIDPNDAVGREFEKKIRG
ncbi:MAG: hypothetical protein RLZZ455_291 [Candidatus Parcubacteria bacterium]|jgi:tetratricopeptide (TPR) repeat protein